MLPKTTWDLDMGMGLAAMRSVDANDEIPFVFV